MKPDRKTLLLILIMLLFLGVFAYLFIFPRPVTFIIDGITQKSNTHAWTVTSALQAAGFQIGPADIVDPPSEQLIGWDDTITLQRASTVYIWSDGEGLVQAFLSTKRTPTEIFSQAGITVSASTCCWWNGLRVSPDQTLAPAPTYVLQYRNPVQISLLEEGQKQELETSAFMLGQAFWEAGIRLVKADDLSLALTKPLNESLSVALRRSRLLNVQVGDKNVSIRTAAATIGQALAGAGISLQEMDYAIPSEEQPLPKDGSIQIVRVREEIILEQTPIPFESEFVADPEIELDQTRELDPGTPGVQVTRLRIRYETDQETARNTEASWVASPPISHKVGYGTKIVIKKASTPDGTIEYWRAITAYATSYSPCGLGTVAKCSYSTSSGMKVQKGVAAVTLKWYRLMKGQVVYVEGYGIATIGDVGGGIPVKRWIDLAYTDEDYVPWYWNVTVYFLTPVPANVPWILP